MDPRTLAAGAARNRPLNLGRTKGAGGYFIRQGDHKPWRTDKSVSAWTGGDDQLRRRQRDVTLAFWVVLREREYFLVLICVYSAPA